MRELFRERALTTVTHYQFLLQAAGIETFIKNENVSAMEGVAIPEFFPALCVIHDDDYEVAVELIKKEIARADKASLTEVTCGACGNKSPSTFDLCWNCQVDLAETK